MKSLLWRSLFSAIITLSVLAACDGPARKDDSLLRILSGSENSTLEPLLQEFTTGEDPTIEITYAGSVDIMRELMLGTGSSYDAVWPANGMWIQLGDTSGVTRFSASIMRSPVVLGVKKSVAGRLGWIGTDVYVDEVLAAAESGQLRFMMSNASQSDSGAAAYLGFLYAFAGHPDLLTSADLQNPLVQEKAQRILSQVGRSAGNSGLLKELFLQDYDSYDAMYNYESVIIETNMALVDSGQEPLYAIYPVDGTAIADSPLAFISKGNAKKQESFQALQAFLASDETQAKLLQSGRRAGLGINPSNTDPAVFNPDWGIDTQRILTPIKIPDAEVVKEALTLYQTTFRKPSFTVFALDFSGSMEGKGEIAVKKAMRLLLDQHSAEPFFLQATPWDVTVVITFNDKVIHVWEVEGNDPDKLLALANNIDASSADGGTDIYSPVIAGLSKIKERGTDGYFPAVVLLTDGKSQDGLKYEDLEASVALSGMSYVPIFAITFGDASLDQLQQIAALSSGSVFDGTTDLIGAFRQVRINN